MSQKITAPHERVDAIPVISAQLKQMRVAAWLDHPFPTNGNGTGWRLGWVTVVWLPFLLSAGDHRRSPVEPWGKEQQRTRSRCLGSRVKPRDGTDDRLATGRDDWSVTENWGEWEGALQQHVLRVYHLHARLARVESTPVAAFVPPEGRCQCGHRKAYRPDLPQLKSALAVLDPLGLPLTTTGVAGNPADEPLSRPASAHVRTIVAITGLTDVGDGTMASLGTRAAMVAPTESSLCPRSATQMPAAALDRLLERVGSGAPTRAAPADATDDPVAVGFEDPGEPRAQAPAGQRQCWPERRLVVRARAFAASQETARRQRAARAVAALHALDERQQGKTLLADAAAAPPAAAAILAPHRVAALGHVDGQTKTHAHLKRR